METKPIIKLDIKNELDIVLAHKKTQELCEFISVPVSDRTRFITAISEICRNCLEHSDGGSFSLSVLYKSQSGYLQAVIKDVGPGISNLEEILKRKGKDRFGKGYGIVNAQKLADIFDIETSRKGTVVKICKAMPLKHPPINDSIIKGWIDYFTKEKKISPYEEIKRQNNQLMELSEQLRLKNLEAEKTLCQVKELNKELHEKSSELEKKNFELEDFAYTISHDLKAPLKNLQGLTEALKEASMDDMEHIAPLLSDQVTKMETLINSILQYAKSGHNDVEKNEVYLKEFLIDVVSTLRIPPAFSVHLPSSNLIFQTEDIYLNQIFSNLISNAVKYHDQNWGNVWINFKTYENKIEFSVRDDGPGIEKKYQDKIFNIFNTGNKTSASSSGIGLSIVKKLIERRGGKIHVQSEGRGSDFRFTWPLDSESYSPIQISDISEASTVVNKKGDHF